MKKTYIWIFACISSLTILSCDEREIEVFGEKHCINFEKFFINAAHPGTEQADSTEVSFFFATDDEKFVTADLIIHLSGRKLDSDLPFKLRVVPELTTALPDEYVLESNYKFKAKPIPSGVALISDTIGIKMKRSSRLSQFPNGVTLVLEVVLDDKIQAGQFERSRAKIILTEDSVRPLWWTAEVEVFLLGNYSVKKYKMFLKHVPNAVTLNQSMIINEPDNAIKLTRAFKKWISEQDPSNPDIYEETGELMTVNV